MSKPTVLSSEERTFLARLLTSEAATLPAERSFMIDGGDTGNTLLSSLATHSKMSLESRFAEFWMSFPLTLAEDEFHALRLTLGAPRIYEYGPNQRPWRLRLETPIALQDGNGKPTGLRVRELSPSGLLLDLSTTDSAPTQFSLWLPLPDQDPVQIRGTLVRAKGMRLAAYRIRLVRPEQAEDVRRFIFRQHRLQHPELEIDAPV